MKNIFKKHKVHNSDRAVPDEVFGHIDLLDGKRIAGWAGPREDESFDLTVYVNGVYLYNVKPSLIRVDVQSIESFKHCKGFDFEFEISEIVSVLKEYAREDLLVTMKINGKQLKKEFSFSKMEWLKSLSKQYDREDFLQFLPLFGHGFERSLELGQLIDALLDFESYALNKALVSERSLLVGEINSRNIEDEEDREKLYRLLLKHQDILLEVAKGLYITDNEQLLSLVNQVLNVMNHQDAQQIIANAIAGKENIFNVEKLTKDIEKDELLFYLSNHPEEIIETWRKFDAKERLEKAFSFMNLFVFLQEFDSIYKLELSLNELSELVSSDTKLTVEALQQQLFSNNNEWEGLLVTLYFISSGVKKQQLINLSENVISYLSKFNYVNTSALEWMLDTKLFNNSEVENAIINEMMKKLRWVIDSKSLWNDALIKKVYFNYVNRLLLSRDLLFDDIYKLGLSHYLLDDAFFIKEQLMTQQYLSKEHLTWIQSVESSRRKAILLLDDLSQVEALVHQLDILEYLSPEIVKKIKFELYSNIMNLDADRSKVENAAYGLLKVGGAYDGLMASRKLSDKALQNQYEATLIANTIKWQSKSSNNYWYRQALLLRRSAESERLDFLQKLYIQIHDVAV